MWILDDYIETTLSSIDVACFLAKPEPSHCRPVSDPKRS